MLDFIGNYERAFLSAALLSKGVKKANSLVSIHQLSLPEGCLYDFDLELIDLFEKIKNPNEPNQSGSRMNIIESDRPSSIDLLKENSSKIWKMSCLISFFVNLL